jgi:peptide/nickel transport system substrate-binding protein
MRPGDSDSLDSLIDDYAARRVSRRVFFMRSGAYGLSVTAAGALLASCNDDDAADSDADADAKPVRGGQLIEGYDRDFSKLDSVLTVWDDPAMVALYEYPLARDPSGKYVPALVDSWEVSDDLLEWTLTIPAGLTFQSGEPVDAQVVADNFNLFRDPNQGQNAIFWATVKNVKAPNASSVVVTMNAPFTAFPETLAAETSMIENVKLRKRLGEDYGAQETDGTGPFTLESFKPGTEVVVNRWPDYPGTNLPMVRNQGPAYLDSVKWVPILEVGSRAAEVETGNVHVAVSPAPQDVERLESNSDLVVVSFPALANYFLALNQEDSDLGFDDQRVRQAISHAIDRQALVDSVFFGQAVPTYGPIAPNFKWYDAGVEEFNQFDPERAASLLDEAGWTAGSGGIREKGGQRLSYQSMNPGAALPTTRTIDEAIVPMLAEVGVEMKLDIPQEADFWGRLADLKNLPSAWSYEWLWSSPVDLLIYFSAYPTKAYNGDLSSINAAIKEWQQGPDEATLEQAARDLQLSWAEELPLIPILTRNAIWVHQKKVMGYQPLETMLYPFYNDVWIAA